MKPTFQTEGGPALAKRPRRHGGPPFSQAGASFVLGAWVVSLPLGTTPQEVMTGVAVLATLWWGRQQPAALRATALWAPVALWALAAWAQALHPDGDPTMALGRTWVASAAWCVPALARLAGGTSWLSWGAWSAAAVTVLVVAQAGAGLGATPGGLGFEGRGLYSHHLTLAYAWVPLVCLTLGRGWRRLGAWLVAGVVATSSLGAVAGLGLGAVAGWVHARWGRIPGVLAAGAAVLSGMAALAAAPADMLQERAILWTGGAQLGLAGGAPLGRWRTVVEPVHRSIDPDFFFPHHAHDVSLQALGDVGAAGWIAVCWAVVVLLRRGSPAMTAMVVALAVGGWSQDWLGDVEVARSVLVWTSLALIGALPTPTSPPRPQRAPSVQPH